MNKPISQSVNLQPKRATRSNKKWKRFTSALCVCIVNLGHFNRRLDLEAKTLQVGETKRQKEVLYFAPYSFL